MAAGSFRLRIADYHAKRQSVPSASDPVRKGRSSRPPFDLYHGQPAQTFKPAVLQTLRTPPKPQAAIPALRERCGHRRTCARQTRRSRQPALRERCADHRPCAKANAAHAATASGGSLMLPRLGHRLLQLRQIDRARDQVGPDHQRRRALYAQLMRQFRLASIRACTAGSSMSLRHPRPVQPKRRGPSSRAEAAWCPAAASSPRPASWRRRPASAPPAAPWFPARSAGPRIGRSL